MREAGFEPANPKDDGLSDAALTTNRFAPYCVIFCLVFVYTGGGSPIPDTILFFKLFSRNQSLFMRTHNIQPANV